MDGWCFFLVLVKMEVCSILLVPLCFPDMEALWGDFGGEEEGSRALSLSTFHHSRPSHIVFD